MATCHGSLVTYVVYTSALAWYLHTHMRRITGHHNPNGLVFLHGRDPIAFVEGGKVLSARVVTRTRDWRAPLLSLI